MVAGGSSFPWKEPAEPSRTPMRRFGVRSRPVAVPTASLWGLWGGRGQLCPIGGLPPPQQGHGDGGVLGSLGGLPVLVHTSPTPLPPNFVPSRF